MAESKKQKQGYSNLIIAIICIVVGILFCCSLAIALETLSIILGVILIVLGAAAIVMTIISKESLLSISGIFGAIFIGIGIASIVLNYAAFVLTCIPFLLISLGFFAMVDAFLLKFVRKEKSLLAFILELVIGAICFTLGILLLTVDEFVGYAGLILGIALIIFGVFSLVIECMKLSKKK